MVCLRTHSSKIPLDMKQSPMGLKCDERILALLKDLLFDGLYTPCCLKSGYYHQLRDEETKAKRG